MMLRPWEDGGAGGSSFAWDGDASAWPFFRNRRQRTQSSMLFTKHEGIGGPQ